MNPSIYGVEVEFSLYEEVIIDSAEQPGVILGLRMDTSTMRTVEYLVGFRHGSVWLYNNSFFWGVDGTTGSHNHTEGWFASYELRHISG